MAEIATAPPRLRLCIFRRNHALTMERANGSFCRRPFGCEAGADDARAYFLVADFDLIERPSRNDLFHMPLGVRPIVFTICSRVFPDPASSDRRRSSL